MAASLSAVCDNLELQEKQARRLIAILAVDDSTRQVRRGFQLPHQRLAQVLGVSEPFTALVGSYLAYRRCQRTFGTEQTIRPSGSSHAQVVLRGDVPREGDLLLLCTSGDRTEQMAELLKAALERKIRVDPPTVKTIESMLSRACGMAWETVTGALQRQQAAQHTTPSTTAMGATA